MKPIDADELIEFIENRYEITWESDTYEGGIKDACVDILEKIKGMLTFRLEPKTVREKLNSMTDDEFAEWLCHQIFPDYDEDDVINVMRYQSVRNFLKMDIEQAKEDGR